MVSITIVLGVVLYLYIVPLMTTNTAPKAQIGLVAEGWINGTLTISFATIANAPHLKPADLRYQIASPNGTIYFFGPAGNASVVANVSVSVMFEDADSDGFVTGLDRIRVSGNSQGVAVTHGCAFRLLLGGEVVGLIERLP